MKPSPHDAVDLQDPPSNLIRAGALSRRLPPDPVDATVDRQGNVATVQPRERIRVRLITELALPSRATNALLRSGIRTVGQLTGRSMEDLLAEIIGIGERTLKIIEATLAQDGLTLAPAERPSSAFTRELTSQPWIRKNIRSIKNHNSWVSAADTSPHP